MYQHLMLAAVDDCGCGCCCGDGEEVVVVLVVDGGGCGDVVMDDS